MTTGEGMLEVAATAVGASVEPTLTTGAGIFELPGTVVGVAVASVPATVLD
jgi:hypothetical protein